MAGKMPSWASLGLMWLSWKDMRGDSFSLLVVVLVLCSVLELEEPKL